MLTVNALLLFSCLFACKTEIAKFDCENVEIIEAPLGLSIAEEDKYYYENYGFVPPLNQKYKNYFPLGVAVANHQRFSLEGELVQYHFDAITPENELKPNYVQPFEGDWRWDDADNLLVFAQMNNKEFHGHCLVWHWQTGEWMFQSPDNPNNLVSREKLIERMKTHISTVVGRYKGKIIYWDVVNEVISTDNTNRDNLYSPSYWYEIVGPEFIELAFQFAHEADPDALLVFNEYGLADPQKRAKALKVIGALLEKGVKIDAVAEQAHWFLNWPSTEQIRDMIHDFHALGQQYGVDLKFLISELDIDVYNGNTNVAEMAYASVEEDLTARYDELFKVFREESDKIDKLSFWHISDKYTWLEFYFAPGRATYPLLFDKERKPKACFWSVVNFDAGSEFESLRQNWIEENLCD
ncbi:endo-1,4-beta-xylanase [Tamlana flava]|uniref:endo-1,4-beta-xylanase n=1 Tax=Tamlana flava TaxID=3158572 RepID=UPI00351AB54F